VPAEIEALGVAAVAGVGAGVATPAFTGADGVWVEAAPLAGWGRVLVDAGPGDTGPCPGPDVDVALVGVEGFAVAAPGAVAAALPLAGSDGVEPPAPGTAPGALPAPGGDGVLGALPVAGCDGVEPPSTGTVAGTLPAAGGDRVLSALLVAGSDGVEPASTGTAAGPLPAAPSDGAEPLDPAAELGGTPAVLATEAVASARAAITGRYASDAVISATTHETRRAAESRLRQREAD
jgi:hypothetical protein